MPKGFVNIGELNDQFRAMSQFNLSPYVQGLDLANRLALIRLVQDFNSFPLADDPYQEHAAGAISYQGEPYFWKIDYHDITQDGPSPNLFDPDVTRRVLTLMHLSEY